MSSSQPGVLAFIRAYSLPLIAGVLGALAFANAAPSAYEKFIHWSPLDGICASAESDGTFCFAPHHAGSENAADAHVTDGHAADGHAADGHAADPHAAEEHHVGDGEHVAAPRVFGFFGHHLTLHFLINDIFMLLFFGIAAKEITQSFLPGGALNPPGKAINPIAATLGGVTGPVVVFLVCAALFVKTGLIHTDDPQTAFSAIPSAFVPGAVFADSHAASVYRGWGVPTATDIALAWLTARIVFGDSHPAVNFLLLLAIVDDAIGLIIIAVFYPSAEHPVAPIWLLLVVAGMAVSFALRKRGVRSWVPYIALGGLLSWIGLMKASLHPALALVPIVPFLPSSRFTPSGAEEEGPLQHFEHDLKATVDYGLLLFGLVNAGVQFASITAVTWAITIALIIGKIGGITIFAATANALGFRYPTGMGLRHVIVAGAVAGMGLTVALFVAGEAYPGHSMHQGPAKMGALFSAFAAVVALGLGAVLRAKTLDPPRGEER